MDRIPKPFVKEIDYGAGKIGEKNHAQSHVKAAGNGVNNEAVGKKNQQTECHRLDD